MTERDLFQVMIRAAPAANIVGYAVVEIYTNDLENEPAQTYSAKLLKSVSFPKANREYQKITAEYVATEMEQIKNETQAGQRW